MEGHRACLSQFEGTARGIREASLTNAPPSKAVLEICLLSGRQGMEDGEAAEVHNSMWQYAPIWELMAVQYEHEEFGVHRLKGR